jgi:diguanylate cyclase (GGDEF)-like protein/PAS domain S-box-containing protein
MVRNVREPGSAARGSIVGVAATLVVLGAGSLATPAAKLPAAVALLAVPTLALRPRPGPERHDARRAALDASLLAGACAALVPWPQAAILAAAVAAVGWSVGLAAEATAYAAVERALVALAVAVLATALLTKPLVAVAALPLLALARSRWRHWVPTASLFVGQNLVLVALTVAPAALAPAIAARSARAEIAVGALVALRLAVSRYDDRHGRRLLEEDVVARNLMIVEQAQWFRALVQNSSDVVTVVDESGVVRYQSPAVAAVFGHDPATAVARPFGDVLRARDAARVAAELEQAAATRTSRRLEFPVRHADGTWRDTETTVMSLLDDADVRGIVLNTRDVTERKRLEAELTRAAFTDPLTGLANRALFRDRVERALASTGPGAPVAVVYCDLNGFKAVNDAHGHAIGDQLLGLVAERLQHCVRPGDTVARLGGDEFAVLLAGPNADSAAVTVAERIGAILQQPCLLDGREIYVGTSTGIATSATADTADTLLRNADLAMYRSKAAGERPYVWFEPRMHDDLLARVALESDLRQALSRDELLLHYQPTVDLASGRIVGVEALLRWYHAERGSVPPMDVVTLAESSGLITTIGEWVVREATAQAAAWQPYATSGEVFTVAVNVSGRQLHPGFVTTVAAALAESGLPPAALVLEMIETVLIERTEETIDVLRGLKRLGVRLAIDDFGTGYSSLSYLSRFPVDILKIDRGFIESIGTSRSEEAELTRTIVGLGRSLGLTTVAEGVERGQQLTELRAMGCILGQGFLFSRAMPPMQVAELLELRPEPVPRRLAVA